MGKLKVSITSPKSFYTCGETIRGEVSYSKKSDYLVYEVILNL